MTNSTPSSPGTTSSDEQQDISTAQDFLYRDEPLSPKMISSLMHVGASLHTTHVHEMTHEKEGVSVVLYYLVVITLSVILASVIGGIFFYTHEIGPFYSAAAEEF